MGRSFALLATLLTGASLATAAVTPPPDPPFAVQAAERLVIRKHARIRGGAVGAFGESRSAVAGPVSEVTVEGARVAGDVYGAAVRLTAGAAVQRVFANAFTADRSARHGEVAPLPGELPTPPTVLPRAPGTDDLVVPPGARVYLSGHPARVDVQPRGTLVLAGGQFQVERLTLGERSRLEVEAPSRLVVLRAFRTGPRAFVGPARRGGPLNLAIAVAGSDVGPGPRVLVGAGSSVQAAISAPRGTVSLGERVKTIGSVHGRVIDIGPRVSVVLPPGLLLGYDACHIPWCRVDATAGGSIDVVCSPVPLAAGTPCDDGAVCTKDDVCDERAQCAGTPIPPLNDPDDVLKCKRSICDPELGPFEAEGTSCDTFNQCREPYTCNATGDCSNPGAPLPDGTPCDDGIPNNGPDTCGGGWCHGALGQFDCRANDCSAVPGAPPDLDCWLAQHPHVKASLYWGRLDGLQLDWDSWEPWRKLALQQALVDAWNWYASGMTSFQGTPVPEPPPNHEPLADASYPATVLDESTEAWPLFAASVAHTLAAEIGGWVPWSLCDYDAGSRELRLLLASHERWWAPPSAYPGYTVWGRGTPAHPTLVFAFLSQNGLIGGTRLETIANLIGWSRRLTHFLGGYTTQNFEYYWQYRGAPPVSRVLAGTILTDPQYAQSFPTPEHWTAGCWGTSSFLVELLRAVNVPVDLESVCGHSTPHFLSEGRWLSHGDDPYDGFAEGSTTLVPPLQDYLIDEATHAAWFDGSPEEACDNVARRPRELMVAYPPDWLVSVYCSDVAAGRDHASSVVYMNLSYHFTVAELEAAGLWTTLAQRATDLGYACGAP